MVIGHRRRKEYQLQKYENDMNPRQDLKENDEMIYHSWRNLQKLDCFHTVNQHESEIGMGKPILREMKLSRERLFWYSKYVFSTCSLRGPSCCHQKEMIDETGSAKDTIYAWHTVEAVAISTYNRYSLLHRRLVMIAWDLPEWSIHTNYFRETQQTGLPNTPSRLSTHPR